MLSFRLPRANRTNFFLTPLLSISSLDSRLSSPSELMQLHWCLRLHLHLHLHSCIGATYDHVFLVFFPQSRHSLALQPASYVLHRAKPAALRHDAAANNHPSTPTQSTLARFQNQGGEQPSPGALCRRFQPRLPSKPPQLSIWRPVHMTTWYRELPFFDPRSVPVLPALHLQIVACFFFVVFVTLIRPSSPDKRHEPGTLGRLLNRFQERSAVALRQKKTAG